MLRRILALSCLAISVTFNAYAAPTVTEVATGPTPGSIVLKGSSFGTMNGSIVTWDNFDTQAAAAQITGKAPVIGPKYNTLVGNNAALTFTSSKAHSGNLSAKIDWPLSGGRIASFGWSGQGPFSQLYITYWRYMESNEDPLLSTTNHKQYYLYGSDTSLGYQMPQAMPFIPQGTQNWGFYNNNSTSQGSWSSTNNINTIGKNWSNTLNRWGRWEFWQKLNDDPACTIGSNCNGELKVWIDAALATSRNDYKHRFVNGRYADFKLGMMHGTTSIPAYGYFDDLYIATTQARVEIGNAADWNACTQREIQIPQSWTDGQIEISLNKGAFKDATAYIFVVDSNGEVSSGKPVSLSSALVMPPQGLKATPIK